MGSLPLPLVTAQGTPGEIGAAYGASAAPLIHANNAAYLERFAARGLDALAVRRAGAAFRAETAARFPRIAATLDGVGEGAAVVVEEIYALNARSELLYGVLASECTAIGVLDSRSASGHTLLAQNWDWHPAHRSASLLLATRDERGFETVALTEAGMLAKAGLNSAGLGVCVNLLHSDRDGRPGGVPYHVLLRAVLEARTLTEAIRVACGSPRGASINLLIGQAFGDEIPGEVIDLELAPGDVGVLHPTDGLLTHANHFLAPVAVRDTVRDEGGSSFFRGARAARLLGDGMLEEKDLAEVLADHGGYPDSICRHDVADRAEDDRSESLFSVLMDLDERRLAVAAGPPCGVPEYVDVRLDRLFR